MEENKVTLVLVACAGHDAEIVGRPAPLVKVAGLGVLSRAVKTSWLNGISSLCLVVDEGSASAGLLVAEAKSAWNESGEFKLVKLPKEAGEAGAIGAASRCCTGYLLIMFADFSMDPKAVGAFLQKAKTHFGQKKLLVPSGELGSLALVPADFAAGLSPGIELAEILKKAKNDNQLEQIDTGIGFSLRLSSKADIRKAARLQIRALRRPTDGIVSRWLNRPVSLWLSKNLFCRLPLTPNQITFLAAVIGWAAIGLVWWWNGYWWTLLGAGLFHLSSILDGCDGEVARLRLQFSRFGEWFDNVLDEVNNALFIAAIGLGIWRTGGPEIYAWAAAFHLLTVAIVDSATFYQLIRYRGGTGSIDYMRWFFQSPKTSAVAPFEKRSRLGWLMQLVRRDFYILMLLILAIFDVLHYGFWITLAVDCVLFVLGLLQWGWQLSRRGRESLAGGAA